MRIMDRRSRRAEIKLVSKYYPVANYSYPSPVSPTSPTSPTSSHVDRCSVGSEASAPGLIDDRTDSEVSQEDDYQYGVHTNELWDSFWQAGGEWRLENEDCKAPRQRTEPKANKSAESKGVSWPLPNSKTNTRKPAATYSAFPSMKPLPPMSGLVPAPLSPRSPITSTITSTCIPPPRPRRPEALLTPCLKQPGRNPATWPSTAPALTPTPEHRPKTSAGITHRPKKSMDGHARGHSNVLGIQSGVPSRSSEDLSKALSSQESQQHAPRHYKSTTYLGAARQQHRQQQLQQQLQDQQAEPHSVFEDDSDCEESGGISFFRFHKRSGSDRSYKAATSPTAAAQDPATLRKRRNRADTIPAPSSSTKSPSSDRERKVDVFGRMLGRRSR